MPVVTIFSSVRPFSILCKDSDSVSDVIRKICRRHIGTPSACKLFSVPLAALWQGFEDSDEAPLCADREMRDILAELSPTNVLYLTREVCSAKQKALPLENDPCRHSSTRLDLTERLSPLGVHLLGSKGSVKHLQTCGTRNGEEAQCIRNLPQSAFDIATTAIPNSECSSLPMLAAVHSEIDPGLELETSNKGSDEIEITKNDSDDDVLIVGVDGPEHPVTTEHVLSVLQAEQSRCWPTHTWDTNVAMRKLKAVFGKAVDDAAMRELVVRSMRSGVALKAPPQPYPPGVLDTIQCCGMTLASDDLHTLEPSGWLNDQIINCYLKLILKSSPSTMRTFAVSTFFYSKLAQGGYHGIRKWLKGAKMNMLRLNLLLVPVHTDAHWSLVAIFAKRRRIEYYDSLGLKNGLCVKRLQMLCAKEECSLWKRQQKQHLNKSPSAIKSACSRMHWKLCYPKDIPTQDNWSDCGVFVCQFARYLVTGWPSIQFPFSSRHMPLIRRTMLQELRTGRLIDMNFKTHTAD